jgi:choline dehydrogenase-like flavoprotein
MMHYIIGSGPSAISCAQALVDSNQNVTIIDAGFEIEKEKSLLLDNISHKLINEITYNEINSITLYQTKEKIPKKLIHGSDFPYRTFPGAHHLIQKNPLSIYMSHAKGGFSNVWGSAVLPYEAEDFEDWPLSLQEMQPYYEAVSKFMPITNTNDELASRFSWLLTDNSSLDHSCQIKQFKLNYNRYRKKLMKLGVLCGAARLAVDLSGKCIYCQRCMHGCYRNILYTSNKTLNKLISDNKVSYLKGYYVTHVYEHKNYVLIKGHDIEKNKFEFSANKVFLGAGVINTTAILMRSKGIYNKPVEIKDSQYFIFPMFQFRGASNVYTERLYTLSQLFMEITDKNISGHTIHLQIYSYSEHLKKAIETRIGFLSKFLPMEWILGHLIFVGGYLHSDDSSKIELVLSKINAQEIVTLNPILNANTSKKIYQVMLRLLKLSYYLKAIPLLPLVEIGSPGRGHHFGGSYPMSNQTKEGYTDTLGRPSGSNRMHIVDASVFPSVASQTITYTIMANAYRIGKLSCTSHKGR